MIYCQKIAVFIATMSISGCLASQDMRAYIPSVDAILAAYHPHQPYASTFNNIPLEPATIQLWHGQPADYTLLAVEHWIKRQPEILKHLLPTPEKLSTALDSFNNNHLWLYEQGIENVSNHNYVFSLPELPQHYIKISGPQHRLVNIIVGAGYESLLCKETLYVYPSEISSVIYRAGIPLIDSLERVPTYQTMSQYAYYLLIQEAIARYHLHTITVPRTELLQITPGPASDETCIIIQEKIAKKSLHKFRTAAIMHLIMLVLATGIWDLHEDNIITHKKGVILIDLEQPNRYAPQEFLHKNPEPIIKHVCEGLESLAKVLKKRAWRNQFKKAQALIRYVLEHQSEYARTLNSNYGHRLRKAYKLR